MAHLIVVFYAKILKPGIILHKLLVSEAQTEIAPDMLPAIQKGQSDMPATIPQTQNDPAVSSDYS
jgi:hypothetical protein